VDDSLEGLARLVGALLAVGLAIYLLILLVILVVPVMLYVLAVGYGGRRLARQVQRYELGGRAYLVLCGLGALAVLATAVPAYTAAWHPLTMALAVPLFLGLATTTLGIWAAAKVVPYRQRLEALEDEVARAEAEARAVERAAAALAAMAAGIEARHGVALRLREDLNGFVERMAETDAQVWGVRKRQLEAEFRNLSDSELVTRLAEAQVEVERPLAGPDATAAAMWACLLRAEALGRVLARPNEELRSIRRQLEEHGRNQQRVRARLDQLRLARGRAITALEGFRSGRVRLG
jgi:hypothetical protein